MDTSKIEHPGQQGHTHLPHAEQEFENHEQTDVAIRPLVVTLGALAVVLLVSYVGMWGTFELFKAQTQSPANNPRMSEVKSGLRQVPEGLPALQGVPAAEANPNTPAQDMDDLRERSALVLSGQRPMRDKKQQPGMKPGMPIELAMDAAMSRKIFKTQASPAARGGGKQRPGKGNARARPESREAGGASGAGEQR